MNELLRRIKGAVGMGLTWAITGFVAGMGIELIHNIWPNPIGAAVDIWPMVLAVPGLFGGLSFSLVLAIAGRRKRFDELSLGRFAILGAAGGLLASLVPAALMTAGGAAPLWEIVLGLGGPFVIGGAIAASGTLALARLSEDQELLASGEDIADVGLTAEEQRELLGNR